MKKENLEKLKKVFQDANTDPNEVKEQQESNKDSLGNTISNTTTQYDWGEISGNGFGIDTANISNVLDTSLQWGNNTWQTTTNTTGGYHYNTNYNTNYVFDSPLKDKFFDFNRYEKLSDKRKLIVDKLLNYFLENDTHDYNVVSFIMNTLDNYGLTKDVKKDE